MMSSEHIYASGDFEPVVDLHVLGVSQTAVQTALSALSITERYLSSEERLALQPIKSALVEASNSW